MQKVLVTGATGYIGSHLVKALSKTGLFEVYGTDFNMFQNKIGQYISSPVVNYDIRDSKNCPFTKGQFDIVIHLAAKTSIEPSWVDPENYFKTNIEGTRNVINNICSKDTHFIYCSTGVAAHSGSSPYALSKRGGEMLAEKLDKFSICRFYNVSGNDGFYKFDNHYRNIIRRLAATVLGEFGSFYVYGNNYGTPDGTTFRHYTHVIDIVNAVVLMAKNAPTKDVQYFGHSQGYSVWDVIKAMESVSGKKINIVISDSRQGDVPKSFAPQNSRFFRETFTLEQQCESAILAESYYLDNYYKSLK